VHQAEGADKGTAVDLMTVNVGQHCCFYREFRIRLNQFLQHPCWTTALLTSDRNTPNNCKNCAVEEDSFTKQVLHMHLGHPASEAEDRLPYLPAEPTANSKWHRSHQTVRRKLQRK
jgi:hypothetical protein